MAVIIGHASTGENGIRGGQAGDQTGKEVCTRTWYNKNWSYVLRCKDSILAEKMAISCEKACSNNNIGYDQGQRNTLRTQAYLNMFDLSKIKIPCECDCSSLMTVCAECAGIKIPYSGTNAPTTRTMKSAFVSTGLFDVLIGNQYSTSSDLLKRGDILVKEGSHTVMVLSNGKTSTTSSAKINQSYIVGNTYRTEANLYIRLSPDGDKMEMKSLTTNAQINAYTDADGYSILKKGTRVTCKGIKELNDSTWMNIPSGWICAKNSTKTFVK